MDSDDSDFYGDDEEARGLQNRVDQFDAGMWLRQQQAHPGRPLPRRLWSTNRSQLHNPYAGVSFAWQLTETVESFLERLRPSTTDVTPDTPWIFICNPFIPRVAKKDGENQYSKGNEDEAPTEVGSRVLLVEEGGKERLNILRDFIDATEKTRKAKSTIEKLCSSERKQAVADILDLAHAGKVRPGKWMLFCTPQDVNQVWETVAKATASNELGIAAKVAPRSAIEDARRDRLICVYTADFRDKTDVGRVLQRLRELRLVEARSRTIYYKPDALTYIGISYNNPWGVKASIYSSIDIF